MSRGLFRPHLRAEELQRLDHARMVIDATRGDTRSERQQRRDYESSGYSRDTQSEHHPGIQHNLIGSSLPQANSNLQKPSPRQITGATIRSRSGRDPLSEPPWSSRRTNKEVPAPVQVQHGERRGAGRKQVANSGQNDKTRTDFVIPIEPSDDGALNIPGSGSGSGTASADLQSEEEEQQERSSAVEIEERRERCYKYSQKALGFAICTFFTYLTPASSSSAGKATFVFSMAAFFVAVCADLFSWRRKPRDGRALVCLSSFSLMLMTFLMFISFNSYYACAIPVVPLIMAAGLLVKLKLRPSRHRQQNTDNEDDDDDDDEFNKLLSDVFDFSALVLNSGGFITAFATTTTMHSFSGANEYSFLGFMLLLTVILSLYLMTATTVRVPLLTRHVNYLYSLLQLLLLIMVSVFMTNKMKG